MEAGEPVMVAVGPLHTKWLRDALDGQADVEFVDMEELGLIGMIVVIAAFGFIALAGLKIAMNAPSVMARCVCESNMVRPV